MSDTDNTWPEIWDRTRSSTFRGCWLPRGNKAHSQQGRPILEQNETKQRASKSFLASLKKKFLKLVPLGSLKMRKTDSRMDKEPTSKNQARCPEMEVESCEFALHSCWKRNSILFKAYPPLWPQGSERWKVWHMSKQCASAAPGAR